MAPTIDDTGNSRGPGSESSKRDTNRKNSSIGGDLAAATLDQLERITADEKFARAPKICQLLTYLVRQTIEGEGDRLKGYTVGVEGLGKPEDFDPGTDASVRVETGRLRRMLGAYYRDHPDASVRIEIPKGIYQPKFSLIHSHPEQRSNQRRFSTDYVSPSGGPAVALVKIEWVGSVDADEDQHARLAERLTAEVRQEFFRYREYHLVDIDPSGIHGSIEEYCRARTTCEFLFQAQLLDGNRVSVSLTDLQVGNLIWVETYDLTVDDEDVAALARRLVGPLAKPAGIIPIAAIQKRQHKEPQEWNATDCILQWQNYRLRRRTPEHHAILRTQVRRLLDEDVWFGLGHAIYAMLTLDEVAYRLNPLNDAQTTLNRAKFLIEQIIHSDTGRNAMVHYIKAQTQFFTGDLDGFRASVDRALLLHPHNPDIMHHSGVFLVNAGDVERGRALILEADRMTVPIIGYRLAYLLLDVLGLIEIDGLSLYENTYVSNSFPLAHVLGALLCDRAGDVEGAHDALRRAARAGLPPTEIGEFIDLWFKDAQLNRQVREPLRRLSGSSNIIPLK